MILFNKDQVLNMNGNWNMVVTDVDFFATSLSENQFTGTEFWLFNFCVRRQWPRLQLERDGSGNFGIDGAMEIVATGGRRWNKEVTDK